MDFFPAGPARNFFPRKTHLPSGPFFPRRTFSPRDLALFSLVCTSLFYAVSLGGLFPRGNRGGLFPSGDFFPRGTFSLGELPLGTFSLGGLSPEGDFLPRRIFSARGRTPSGDFSLGGVFPRDPRGTFSRAGFIFPRGTFSLEVLFPRRAGGGLFPQGTPSGDIFPRGLSPSGNFFPA